MSGVNILPRFGGELSKKEKKNSFDQMFYSVWHAHFLKDAADL